MRFSSLRGFVCLTTLSLIAGSLAKDAIARPVHLQATAIAQSSSQKVTAAKAKADQLFQQGTEQSNQYQFTDAFQSWQQAFTLYQEIGDRSGSSKAALNMGLVQTILGDFQAVAGLCWSSVPVLYEADRAAAAIAMSCAGVGVDGLGQAEAAIDYQRRALKIAQEARSRSIEARVLENLALISLNQENFVKAIESGQQSLAIAREVKDRKAESRVLATLGAAFTGLGQFKKSVELEQQSLAIAKATGDRLTEGRVLGYLGLAYGGLKETAKAIDYQQQSLAIAHTIQDRITESLALENLGHSYQASKQIEKATQSYEQSWLVLQSAKNYSRNLQVLASLGDSYFERSDYLKALEYYNQSRSFVKNSLAEIKVYCRLADANFELENYQGAYNQYRGCLNLTRNVVKRPQEEQRALQGLGRISHISAKYGDALKAYQQSLVIARQTQNRASEAKSLSFLGTTFFSIGDSAQAIDYQQQSLALARRSQDDRTQARALSELGRIYAALGEYSKALQYQQQGLELARTVGDRKQEGAILLALGTINRALGNYSKALENQQQSLSIAQSRQDNSSEIHALGALGNTYLAMGNVAQAITILENRLNALVDTANGKRQAAGGNAELSLAMLPEAFGDLGLAYYQAGNLPKAEVRLQDAISSIASRRETLNDTQRVTFLENQNRYLNALQQVLIAQNKTSKALESVENARSRAFLDLLVARLDPAVAKAYYDAIEPPHPSYIAIPRGPLAPSITIERIQQVAKAQNATLVSYSIVEQSNLFIWVIQPSGKITFRTAKLQTSRSPAQPNSQPVAGLVDRLLVTMRGLGVKSASTEIPSSGSIDFKADPQSMKSQLRQLHQQLIEPIADLLPNDPTERVIFVPQGPLFLVPFPALLDAKGQYLIEHHTILTAPAIQVLE